MTQSIVTVERDGSTAIVRLNRPEAMNAISRALRSELAQAFRALQGDASVTAAILTGNGRAFCAGVDLKELASSGGFASADRRRDDELILAAISAFDRPVIGAINGAAITGGFEIALMCDLLIASPAARFADTHARVGVIPGWGLSQLLPRMIGLNRARELSFTGNFLSAEKAEAWGLVNRVVPAGELLPVCLALARDMTGCDAPTLKSYKKLINDGSRMTLGDALLLETTTHDLTRHRATGEAIGARRAGVLDRGRDQSKT